MPISDSELTRDFVLVDERTTVAEVRDRVASAGNKWIYIVIELESGQYAVLQLSELIQALQQDSDELTFEMLYASLRNVPDLLGPRAGEAVEQTSLGTAQAKRQANKMPGKRLVVLADGEVVGLVAIPHRKASVGIDLDWLDKPTDDPTLDMDTCCSMEGELRESDTGQFAAIEELAAEAQPTTLKAEDEAREAMGIVEAEKRWINAEIQDHDPAESLQMGEVYTLAFDVDTELRDMAVGGAELAYQFQADEDLVELTVQLSSDDFEIYSEPQKLRVPRSGKSKGKARFDIESKHDGEGIINAVFLKDGNFIQLIALRLHTGTAPKAGVLSAEPALGRPVEAAFAVQPRDLSLTILNTGTGFQIIMSGAVGAMATLPITLPQLDQMIAQVRQELKDIVYLETGPKKTRVYQAGIDIPPKVNQIALQRLAKAGFRLYQKIFYGPAADSQANLVGDKLRHMAQKGQLKIQIFSQQFMLPWGILYVADEYDPDKVDPELFLGLKHIIEHIPLQQNMQVMDGTIPSDPQLTVSLNVNTDIDKQMGSPLIAKQVGYWNEISKKSGAQVIVRKTESDVTKALADATTADQILYFYCHAVSKSLAEGGGPDDSTLILSGNGRLTLEDLNLRAPAKKMLSGAPLVFINACESAELSPMFYDGFVPYFMTKGARGVIGTECETPALFAAEWARRFFDELLSGKSLGQVMLDLRREFYFKHNNPMGLLYALYCDGDTQIAPGLKIA